MSCYSQIKIRRCPGFFDCVRLFVSHLFRVRLVRLDSSDKYITNDIIHVFDVIGLSLVYLQKYLVKSDKISQNFYV